MKRYVCLLLILLFVCTGVGAIFYGYRFLGHSDLSEKKIKVEQILENQKIGTNEVSYDVELIAPVSNDDIVQAQFKDRIDPQRNLMIGGIWIPEVSLQLPIYKGFANDHQYLGACTYYDRVLGKDNYVLLGHNMLDQGQLFSPLKRVEQGMLIYVTDYQKVYLFQVVFKEVVYEDREDLVENDLSNGQTPLITLITCYGGYNTDKRTVVRGTLISEESLEHSEKVVKEVFKIE